jgi:hypothetical protein
VLADQLLSLGDPRGELIALQLAALEGRASRAQKTRESELLRRHGRSWMGAIEPVIHKSGAKFEAGFLARARAGFIDALHLERVVGREEWATVHTLDVAPWPRAVAPLVQHENMRSLRVLLGADPSVLSLARPITLEILRLRHFPDPAERLIACACLPELRRLELDGENLGFAELDIWSSPLGRSLRELSVRTYVDPVDWILGGAELGGTALTAIETQPIAADTWSVMLRRDADHRFSVLRFYLPVLYRVFDARAELMRILESIPAELPTQIEILAPQGSYDPIRFAPVLARFPRLQPISSSPR